MRCCRRLMGHQAPAAMSLRAGQEQELSLPTEQPVYLKPSRSRRRKPSFLFTRMRDGPPEYAIKAPPLGTALPLFRITSSSCEYYALRLPLVKAGFKRIPTHTNLTIPTNLLWGRSMMLHHPSVGASHSLSYSSTLPTSSSASSLCTRRDVDSDVDLIALSRPSSATRARGEDISSLQMMSNHQRFNHFPRSHSNVGCKWGLAKRLRQVQKSLERAGEKQELYSFLPRTWVYPDEKEALEKVSTESLPTQRFIWKPARGSCGHGIFTCLGGAKNAPYWKRLTAEIESRILSVTPQVSGMVGRKYIVQEYIEEPLLLSERKTDLRLYVAVTSYDPLTVYLHEEGLVRLAAQEYNDGNQGTNFDPFRDLTNYSVGRRWNTTRGKQRSRTQGEGGDAGVVTEIPSCTADPLVVPPPPQLELKKSLKELWDHIDTFYPVEAASTNAPSQRRRSDKVKEEIARVIIKTLIAVKAPLMAAKDILSFPGGFFELYGFDLMLDTKLKPWLVEVNTLPSLASTSSLDYTVKTNLVADLLNLAMIEPFERPPSCFEELDGDARLSGILDPLTKEAAEAVNLWGSGGGDISRSAGQALDNFEARKEISLRLQDELTYCGGFHRIFPPLPCEQTSLVMNELDIFTRRRHLSRADMWAMEA